MALNGTEFVRDPFGTIFSPYTDIFQKTIGNGAVFYIVLIMIFAYGLWIKTENAMFVAMFVVTSGATLGISVYLQFLPELGMIFTVFTALALTGLIVMILLQRRN